MVAAAARAFTIGAARANTLCIANMRFGLRGKGYAAGSRVTLIAGWAYTCNQFHREAVALCFSSISIILSGM